MNHQVTHSRVQVRVGEIVFHTTKTTLTESGLFVSLFALSPPSSGEYFVDNDPELFSHVLRYLRTKMYPIFFDRRTGHDKGLYSAMIHQAEFYQIPSLLGWLRDRKWQQAVRVTTRQFSHLFIGPGQLANMDAYWERDEELTVTSAVMSMQKKKKCAQGLWQHDGNTMACVSRGCKSPQSVTQPVVLPCLDLEGILTKVTVQHDVLRREAADSSEVIVAAMQDPPPYQAEAEAEVSSIGVTVTRAVSTDR